MIRNMNFEEFHTEGERVIKRTEEFLKDMESIRKALYKHTINSPDLYKVIMEGDELITAWLDDLDLVVNKTDVEELKVLAELIIEDEEDDETGDYEDDDKEF